VALCWREEGYASRAEIFESWVRPSGELVTRNRGSPAGVGSSSGANRCPGVGCGGLLITSLATAAGARASGDVVVAASPAEVDLGQPVEVLVRTFQAVDRSDLALPFEAPIAPYPVPSDVWDLLYSWADYPFDVVAQQPGETDVPIALARDPSDSTLWRGTMSLPAAGTWTIWVRNFPGKGPGSTTTVTVRPGRPGSSTSPLPVTPPTSRVASINAGAAGFIGLAVGIVVGVAVALAWKRRPTS
jgi:hypothetical protein